ncbi:MAG: LLM class flavin-dependent oxidoreductase [Acidimicrobiales bacterium]
MAVTEGPPAPIATDLKIRIGVAAGAGVIDEPAGYLALVDALDDLGYDSIWVPDVVTGQVFDPIAALGVAAGRRGRLKIGSHLIVPGRDPVWLAKQLAVEAAAAGRHIDREHYGMNLSWVTGSISDTVRAGIEARRPGFDPNTTIGIGPHGLAERVEAFVEAGFSKFVIRPAEPPGSWAAAVEAMAPVLALQR